jgi:hypothetical protein
MKLNCLRPVLCTLVLAAAMLPRVPKGVKELAASDHPANGESEINFFHSVVMRMKSFSVTAGQSLLDRVLEPLRDFGLIRQAFHRVPIFQYVAKPPQNGSHRLLNAGDVSEAESVMKIKLPEVGNKQRVIKFSCAILAQQGGALPCELK